MVGFTAQPAAGPIQSTLIDLATSPQRVRTDEGTVEERPIPELIQADVYTKLSVPSPQMQGPLWGIAACIVRPPDALGKQFRDPFAPNRML